MPGPNAPLVTVRNRSELRDWLAANHATSGTVWLATYKRHHADYLDWESLVQELLCWGWIDSLPRTVDADRTGHLIAPRNPASAWSAVNKAHAERARADGAMTPAGEAKIAAAQANGIWDFLNDVEALMAPPDLTEALQGTAAEVWAAYPCSVKRGTLEWIKMAKPPANPRRPHRRRGQQRRQRVAPENLSPR